MKMNGKVFNEGDIITLVGSTGEVFDGKLELHEPDISTGHFNTIMQWADEVRVL